MGGRALLTPHAALCGEERGSMPRRDRWLIASLWPISALLFLSVPAARADEHSVEAIVAAIKSPISPEAIAKAREADDKILSGGDVEGVHVYLVTDERSARVNGLVANLLRADGQN